MIKDILDDYGVYSVDLELDLLRHFETLRNEIVEDYSTFNIPEDKIPVYKNPYQFSQTFKKCSLVEYKNISYSDTTQPNLPLPSFEIGEWPEGDILSAYIQ